MASSNKDKTIDYDKQIYKKPEEPLVYLTEFAEKFHERANRAYIPPPPLTDSVYRYRCQKMIFRYRK